MAVDMFFAARPLRAAVVNVEPSHALSKLVESLVPLRPGHRSAERKVPSQSLGDLSLWTVHMDQGGIYPTPRSPLRSSKLLMGWAKGSIFITLSLAIYRFAVGWGTVYTGGVLIQTRIAFGGNIVIRLPFEGRFDHLRQDFHQPVFG